MKPLRELFSLLFQICLMRQGPHAIPAYTVLTLLLAVAYLFLNMSERLLLTNSSFLFSLSASLTNALILAAFPISLLWVKGKLDRYRQLLSALFGQELLLGLIALLPLAALLQQNTDEKTLSPPLISFLLILSCWSISIKGFILNRTLEVSALTGFFLGFTLTASLWFGEVLHSMTYVKP